MASAAIIGMSLRRFLIHGLKNHNRKIIKTELSKRLAHYSESPVPGKPLCQRCYSSVLLNKVYTSSRSVSHTASQYAKTPVVCPAFAESVTEGDIRWVKAVGDSVNVDDVVAEIETDKTTVEVISPISGVVTDLLVKDGTSVRPKQELCKVDTDAAVAAPEKAKKPAKVEAAESPQALSSAKPPKMPIPSELPTVPPPPTKPMTATPVSQIKPTPIGTTPNQGVRTEQRVKMSRMRQRIAQRLKEAQNTCAMLTTFNEVDMSNIMGMRDKYKSQFLKEHGIKLGFMSAFIKASAYALESEPVVNAVIDNAEIVYRDYIDISVAVATPKGLVVPVIRNVETMNYADIEKTIHELGEKARLGTLAIEDMDGGTFTISNGGVFGSLYGTPIINPPQSAILGMHGIFDRPVAVSGKVEVRPMMYIALTYDHRLIDGREAVLFLRKIKSAVEDPTVMFLDL